MEYDSLAVSKVIALTFSTAEFLRWLDRFLERHERKICSVHLLIRLRGQYIIYWASAALLLGVGSINLVESMNALTSSSVIFALRCTRCSVTETSNFETKHTSWNPLTKSCNSSIHFAFNCPVSNRPARYSYTTKRK